MLIKNLVAWAGDRFSYEPGDVIEMPEEIALPRIDAGLAAAHDGKAEKPTILKHQAE
jgi:hypothetical protein